MFSWFDDNIYIISSIVKSDYSDELIGGGFKFSNPNAEKSW